MSLEIVLFKVGPHRCGIPVRLVQEVVWMVSVTHFPRGPAFVEGVVNLRGTVIPILDLRKRFGLEPGPPDSRTRILVVGLRGRPAGLVVDEAEGVEAVEEQDLGLDPAEALGPDLRYVSRVVKSGGDLLVVLDPDRLLTGEEGREFDAALEGGAR